jgi:hypothetical protein
MGHARCDGELAQREAACSQRPNLGDAEPAKADHQSQGRDGKGRPVKRTHFVVLQDDTAALNESIIAQTHRATQLAELRPRPALTPPGWGTLPTCRPL